MKPKLSVIKLILLFACLGYLSIGSANDQHKNLEIYDIKYSERKNVMNCLKVDWKVKNNSNASLSVPTMGLEEDNEHNLELRKDLLQLLKDYPCDSRDH